MVVTPAGLCDLQILFIEFGESETIAEYAESLQIFDFRVAKKAIELALTDRGIRG